MNGAAAGTALDSGLVRKGRTKVQNPWSPPVEVIGMRRKVGKEAEKDAQRLVKATSRRGFPVEPVAIAKGLGVQVFETKFHEDTLGALFLKPGHDPEIVVNRRHSFLRRRLTCALELGHYVRVSAKTNEYKRVDLYAGSEQVGGESDDMYAREFAASVLMPKEDVKVLGDLLMDDLEMALRFLVPREAMQIRLNNLGLRTLDSGAV